MEEKRRHKRLDIDVSVQLERLDEDGVTTLKYCHVDDLLFLLYKSLKI